MMKHVFYHDENAKRTLGAQKYGERFAQPK